jgi:hypothetical protein
MNQVSNRIMEVLYVIFVLCILGWIALFIAPLHHHGCWVFARSCAVIIAAISTLWVIWDIAVFLTSNFSEGHIFASFIKRENDVSILLAAFLAFHLFFGSWQVEDSERFAISHRTLLPFLLLACFLPPLGLCAHMMMRDWQKLKMSREGSM